MYLKKTWYMFLLDFPEVKVIISCLRIIVCNYFDQNIVSDDILDDVGHLDEQEDSGFSSSFFKKNQ